MRATLWVASAPAARSTLRTVAASDTESGLTRPASHAAFLGGGSVLAALTLLVTTGWTGLDGTIHKWATQLGDDHPWVLTVMGGLTHFGSGLPLAFVALVTAVALAWTGRTVDATALAVATASVWIVRSAWRDAVARPRPPGAALDTYAFPSGHAATAAAAALLLVLLAWPLAGRGTRALLVAGAVAWAGTVGASRILLGVHWPSDVLAGWALATAVVIATVGLVHALSAQFDRWPAVPD